MAPRTTKKRAPSPDPDGVFAGMVAYLVQSGVQARRIQIWKQRLEQMGGVVEEKLSNKVTHVFAMNLGAVFKDISDEKKLERFKGSVLSYHWLEETLRLGEKVAEDMYNLKSELEVVKDAAEGKSPKSTEGNESDGQSKSKKMKRLKEEDESFETKNVTGENARDDSSKSASPSAQSPGSPSLSIRSFDAGSDKDDREKDNSSNSSLPYKPPDLNQNITEIFGKLINIYRALGDDRRSFSYYKAIPVIEKVPFKIESADQVKDLPTIGKALKEHIQEIVTTGKLSKLEHFETDERVRTISLFGEVWGVGPATALKLYEKGHRTLDDLKNESSLTHSQQLGLRYFEDIKTRIPRHEVQEMEQLLQKTGEELLPGVSIVCGGSYRRGRPTCGDMDIIITHPDGKRHECHLLLVFPCLVVFLFFIKSKIMKSR
uniref:DNA polymerase n=1 Tax=Kalanchoe fedtschenkoi TaxID=63787 RepID=A0A7N0UK90_KALFE